MKDTKIVGHVLRSNSSSFVVGLGASPANMPALGAFVSTANQESVGLVYNIQVSDDPFVQQLASGPSEQPDLVRQLENRSSLIEASVITIGYRKGVAYLQGLPPRPPMPLAPIFLCADNHVRIFTRDLGFLRLLSNSADVPVDELIVSCLRVAALVRQPSNRAKFLLRAGRELTLLVNNVGLLRLNALLERLSALLAVGV